MGFLPPMPVADTLQKIHQRAWVLPAIQREFVWSRDQIRRLFDSLMRGYPVGSFLLWEVDPGQVDDYTFYDFLTHYHERKNPYATKVDRPLNQGVTAVLDGQQRLTALVIGLYGSHAEKLPNKYFTNPDAYPIKRLYLNLIEPPPTADEELGLRYNLRFLTDDEAAAQVDGIQVWFRLGDILKLSDSGPAIMTVVGERFSDAGHIKAAFHNVFALYDAVRQKPVVNAYLEETTDADKVLDIFVRVNSGGTKLSNSDLLLSMATNQFKELDAREQVRSLVAELGETPGRFRFSKDLVLKAGLVITEAPDIRFKISNFTTANMELLEAHVRR